MPTFTPPTARPRVMFTPTTVLGALARYQADVSGGTVYDLPAGDPDTSRKQAFLYLMDPVANLSQGAAAVDYLNGFVPGGGGFEDDMRQPWPMAVLDWCWNHPEWAAIGPNARDTVVQNWAGWLTTFGGFYSCQPGYQQNNYYVAYLKKALEFAAAIYYENVALRNTFLTDPSLGFFAPGRRYPALLDDLNGSAGGVPVEGSQYGSHVISYFADIVATLDAGGYSIDADTPWFAQAGWGLLYRTTSAACWRKGSDVAYFQIQTRNDDEHNAGFHPCGHVNTNGAVEQDTGHSLSSAAMILASRYTNNAVGRKVRHWMQLVTPDPMVAHHYYDVSGTADPDFSGMPLDYFDSGTPTMICRSSWNPGADVVELALGHWGECEHKHKHTGTYSRQRGAYHLARETNTYAISQQGSIESWSHNCPRIGGADQIWGNVGPLAAQTDPNFAWAVVDWGNSYSTAQKAIRHFLYLRQLEILLIFDAIGGTGPGVPRDSFIHTPNAPTILTNGFLHSNGDQELRIRTLVAAGAPAYSTHDESTDGGASDPNVYQFRNAITETPTSNFWHLRAEQARNAGGADLSYIVQNAADGGLDLTISGATGSYIVHLTRPTDAGGNILQSGGTVTFNGGAAVPLRMDVQGISITADGVAWQ